MKENIRGFSAVYEQAYMELRPSLYNFRNVKKDDHHDRIHGGFIAQEVETTLQKYGMSFNDFAFLCRDSAVSADEYGNPVNAYAEYGITDYLYSVKNEEMIAWNTHMTQKALRHQRKQDGIIARQTAQIEQLMRMNQMLLAQLTKTTAEA